MKYSINEIKTAWDEYKSQKVILYSEGGIKKFKYLDGKRIDMTGITRAQTVDLKSVISFPTFLEEKWQKEK